MKFLVPTDFSKNANNAIAYASVLAKVVKAELIFLHVYVPQVTRKNSAYRFISEEAFFGTYIAAVIERSTRNGKPASGCILTQRTRGNSHGVHRTSFQKIKHFRMALCSSVYFLRALCINECCRMASPDHDPHSFRSFFGGLADPRRPFNFPKKPEGSMIQVGFEGKLDQLLGSDLEPGTGNL